MITNNDFSLAYEILANLTSNSVNQGINTDNYPFSEPLRFQHPIQVAIKILHQAALEGTSEQKKKLDGVKHRITSLNRSLKSDEGCAKLQNQYEINGKWQQFDIKGMKIAHPHTKFEKMIEIATKIPRFVFAVLMDLILLPISLVFTLIPYFKFNFDPLLSEIKMGKTPILLIHGSGYNEMQWIVGRQFLKKKHFGSVFSLNYDGLLSNDSKMGIDDYAKGKIRDKIEEVKRLTGQKSVILIGHSMGGMIAGYYAEFCAEANNTTVKHVIAIATPWRGAPLLDKMSSLGSFFARTGKRMKQMSVKGGTSDDPGFRKSLTAKILESGRKGVRKYYDIWSSTDHAVPEMQGCLEEDPRRQFAYNWLGHYGLTGMPSLWFKIQSWLDGAYLEPNQA